MTAKLKKLDQISLSESAKIAIVSDVWKVVVYGEKNSKPSNLRTETSEIQLFSRCYSALSRCLRLPAAKRKSEILWEICSEERIPRDVSEELIKLLISPQPQSIAKFPHVSSYVFLTDVSWRIKVVISSSYVSRILLPTVELSLSLSDGQTVQFSMSPAKFARLRYELARLLQEMVKLERKPAIAKN